MSIFSGCIHIAGYLQTADPLLPDPTNLVCCWQVFEQLEIKYQGEQITLSSVTAYNDNKLTVVILDPLKRRVFTIIQQGNKVQIEQSERIKSNLPVKWLLIGVYLRKMPDTGWSFEHSDWTVKRDSSQVLLMQDNIIKVSLIEPGILDDTKENTSQQSLTAQLQYFDLKLEVNITTLLRQAL